MIKLQVAGYCQNCPEFKPRVTKDERNLSEYDMRSREFVGPRVCETIITCEYAARCQSISGYIEREVRKKNDLQREVEEGTSDMCR